jgi:hypothetical protein
MKLQGSNFILGTLLFALLIAACGTLQLDVEVQATPTEPAVADVVPPTETGVVEEVSPTAEFHEAQLVDGWLTYTNDRYGYQIQYPPEASIEESGIQGYPSDENGMPAGGLPEGVTLDTYLQYLEQTYGNNLCIQIQTNIGYIMINAPENEGFKYANCGRTGVGVAAITNFELEVRVDGKSYTARGMDIQGGGESLAEHNEDVIVTLDDGTRIEFGPRPTVNATFEDYLLKGRPLLLSILETYVSTQ